MGKHPLADNYRAEREMLLALGRTLTEAEGAVVTPACPAWSIKDVYAHLAGISTDILAGNTEDAATEAWADGHVADRLPRSLTHVLDEWETAGAAVCDVMDEAGDFFPFQLFVDQWTHGWDIRGAIGERAAAAPDLTVYEHFFDDFVANLQTRLPEDLPAVTLHTGEHRIELGRGESIGVLELDLFEYARVSMGRRSRAQLEALPWPDQVADPTPYIDLLVVWSVNRNDVVDPLLG